MNGDPQEASLTFNQVGQIDAVHIKDNLHQ